MKKVLSNLPSSQKCLRKKAGRMTALALSLVLGSCLFTSQALATEKGVTLSAPLQDSVVAGEAGTLYFTVKNYTSHAIKVKVLTKLPKGINQNDYNANTRGCVPRWDTKIFTLPAASKNGPGICTISKGYIVPQYTSSPEFHFFDEIHYNSGKKELVTGVITLKVIHNA